MKRGLGWAPLLHLIFLALPCRADVTLENSICTVTTSEMAISFAGTNVQSITNRITGERYISQPGPGWLDMNTQEPTGETLQAGAWQVKTDPETGRKIGFIDATDSTRSMTLTVGIDPRTEEVYFRLRAVSKKPGLRGVLWGLQGFDASNRFVLPGQAGIYFDSKSPQPRLGLEYPTHWEAQFAFYESKLGGLLIYAQDPHPVHKRLQASREFGTLDIAFEVFARAPWPSAVEVPEIEWRMKAVRGSWRDGVDHYRRWSDKNWSARVPDSRRDWSHSIRSVIVVVHPQTEYLDVLAARLDPAKTLLYMVNWRKDSYDVNYPDYTPSADVGGFVTRAREMGFRLMLHMNAVGVAQYHPAYEALKQYQLRDPDTEEPIFWPWGLWPGNAPPPDYLPSFAFISPAAAAYRKVFFESIQSAMETLKPDAVHLDAGGVMLNDANGMVEGMSSIQGMVQLHREFDQHYPEVALSFESMTETLASFHSFAQRWNSDFASHPVNTYLMGDRVNFYGFLDQENPDEPGFVNYIRRYESQGIMPTLHINSMDDLAESKPLASMLFRLMRLFQEHEFRPDWNADWTGMQFRYKSSNGSTTATVEDQDSVVRMKVGDEVIYERARRTSTLAYPGFVRNWTAYDSSTLFGLDPEKEYWLEPSMTRPEGQVRLSGLPPVAKLGTDSFATDRYGFFDLSPVTPNLFDFANGFRSAKVGTMFQQRDHVLAAGAVAMVSRSQVAGVVKTPALVIQPPYRVLGGAVFVEYETTLPEAQNLFLNFSAGLSDYAPRGDGALFVVRVNGIEQWRETIVQAKAVPVKLNLTRWAGQKVKIRFIAHPGEKLNPTGDIAVWSDVQFSVESTESVVFQVALPSNVDGVSVAGDVTIGNSTRADYLNVESQLPRRFVVFGTAPAAARVGDSLLDLPYDVWQQGYGGWPSPGRKDLSGGLQPVTSGGELEPRALITIPPTKGLTLITWPLRLAEDVSSLQFRVGLADASLPLPLDLSYSGVKFKLNINGEEVWSTEVRDRGWKNNSLNLEKWRGQNVLVQVVADSLSNAIFDWGHWSGLTLR